MNKMGTIMLLICLIIPSVLIASESRCISIAASGYGGWQSIKSAPRDGTTIEMLETYGVAPWYGLFRWGTQYGQSGWWQINRRGFSVMENECLFWRPYKSGKAYVDPTGGAQESMAYWCAYIHRPYDAKRDRCI